MKIRTALVGLIAAVACASSLVAAEEPAEPTPLPAIERCRDFCARIYGDTGGEYEECAVACSDADICHRSCKQKFGGDQDKVQRCLRSCMRHDHQPPSLPQEPGEQPVEL